MARLFDAYIIADWTAAEGKKLGEQPLWVGVAQRHFALTDDMAMLALTMDLAEALSLPMSVVWAAIRNWIDQGLV